MYTSLKESKNSLRDWPAVNLDGLWGFINTVGEIVIEPEYKLAGSFSEGLAWVSVDEIWGAIDRNGNIVIEKKYDFALSFNDGLARVFMRAGTIC